MAKSQLSAVALAVVFMAVLSATSVQAAPKYTSYKSGVWKKSSPILQIVSFTLTSPSKAATFIELRVSAIKSLSKKSPGLISTYHYYKAYTPSKSAAAPGLTFGDAGGILTFDSKSDYDKYQTLIKKEKAYAEANKLIKTTTRAVSIKT